MSYYYLALAILSEVMATSFLKKTTGFTALSPSLIVIGGYALAFYFLSCALETIPVGIAYAIWSGVGIVLICLIGIIFYEQILDAPTLIGIGFVITGVVILNIFARHM